MKRNKYMRNLWTFLSVTWKHFPGLSQPQWRIFQNPFNPINVANIVLGVEPATGVWPERNWHPLVQKPSFVHEFSFRDGDSKTHFPSLINVGWFGLAQILWRPSWLLWAPVCSFLVTFRRCCFAAGFPLLWWLPGSGEGDRDAPSVAEHSTDKYSCDVSELWFSSLTTLHCTKNPLWSTGWGRPS